MYWPDFPSFYYASIIIIKILKFKIEREREEGGRGEKRREFKSASTYLLNKFHFFKPQFPHL